MESGLIDIDVLTTDELETFSPSADLEELARFILRNGEAPGSWSIAVVLTTDRHLRELHRDFMGIDEETDVMTFPRDDDGEQGGDIVISVDRARENAPDAGHSLDDEVRFLIAHGVLHLLGWRDKTAETRDRMLSEQSRLLTQFTAERG